ncbi:hypothetical protein F1642_13685 [Paracoccus sp. NBH48]|nr:hypothetical protein [Paracoccus sp. NBH48]
MIDALTMCVREKLNVVVSGGTSSGKTSIARWLVAKSITANASSLSRTCLT